DTEWPRDTLYIADRHKLRRVRHRRCITHGVRFTDSTQSLTVEMIEGQFNPRGRTYGLGVSDSGWDELLDNQRVFGVDFMYRYLVLGTIPFEQRSIDVNWYGRKAKVPKSEF